MRRVKSMLYSALAVLTLLPVISSAQVIDVSPRSWDFGEMKQQETKTITVNVTNKGAARLIISDVKADCGCTVPEMAVKDLAPGESTTLSIEFNSKRFSGNVIKTVQVFSNDPMNSVVDVMITAKVHTPLIVNPASRRLGFPQSMVGDIGKRVATFTAVDDVELEISADHTRHGKFNLEVRNKVDGDPRKAELVVTLPADMKPGSHRDNVRVKTNLPDMPTVDLELKADVRAPIVVSPANLNFRYRPKFKLNMRIHAFNHRVEFNIKSVKSSLPELKIGEIIEAPGGELIIPISGAPIDAGDPRAIAAKGRIKGTIIILTDLPAMPRIEVPVTYMIRM